MPGTLILLLALVQDGTAAPPGKESDPSRESWKTVDLDFVRVPAGKAFETLARRYGTVIHVPDGAKWPRISLKLEGATFWKALDDLCRDHLNLRIPRQPSLSDEEWIEEGPWIEYPIQYHGPYRLHVRDAGRVREFRYPGRRDRTDVTLVLSFGPGLASVSEWRTARMGDLHLTRAVDDAGKSLLPEMEGDDDFDSRIRSLAGPRSIAWSCRLRPLAPGASRISLLEGEWEGFTLGDIEEVRFDRPSESVGQSRKAGPVIVTLEKCDRGGPFKADDYGSWDFRLSLSIDPGAPAEWKEGLGRIPLAGRIFQEATIEGSDSPFKERARFVLDLRSEEGKDSATGRLCGSSFLMPAEPLALRLKVGKILRPGKFAFSFKDVRLPEEGR